MMLVLGFPHSRWNDNTGNGTMPTCSLICLVTVIGTITSETGDGYVNLLKQCFKLADVTYALIGENLCKDFASVGIHSKMQFVPLSAGFNPMFFLKPLTRATDLQTCAADENMDCPLSAFPWL